MNPITNPLMTRTLLQSLLARKDRALPEYVDILQRPMTLRGSTPALADWLLYFTGPDREALIRYESAMLALDPKSVRDRGMPRAVMGVEENNPRARALYERLGYVEYGGEAAEWDQEDEHGAITRYRTEIALLGKDL